MVNTGGAREDKGKSKSETGRRDDSVFTSLKLHPVQKDRFVKSDTIPTESQYKQLPEGALVFHSFQGDGLKKYMQ